MRSFTFPIIGDKRDGSIVVVAPDRSSARRKAKSAVAELNVKHSSSLTVLETRHPSTRLPNDEATVAFIDTEYDD